VGGIPISVLHNLTIAYRPERLQKSKLRHPPLRLEIEKLIQRSLVMNWVQYSSLVSLCQCAVPHVRQSTTDYCKRSPERIEHEASINDVMFEDLDGKEA
jgi:hypothetical protein